jgi:hypothetical protein
MTTITDILARWATDEGHPYKGQLIDWAQWKSHPDDIGCMCAQGQVLHLLGGWSAIDIRNIDQLNADTATAKLLNISRAHAVLLRNINDRMNSAPGIVLTDPGKILGNQWSKLLDFWWLLDTMTGGGWLPVNAANRKAAQIAARDAARYVANKNVANRNAARDAARDAAGEAAGNASWEIQGASVFERDARAYFFLPMFGFATPADIPSRPANYGSVA